MKIRAVLVACLLTGVADAQRVPKGTYNASQYAEAKAEAAKDGKNIAVIYTEINSTCPKCVYGTETAFKEMRSDYVLVLEDKSPESETGSLPNNIKQKTYATYKVKGNIIPIITIFSSENDTVLSGACYKQISADERKWLKNVEAEIASKPATPASKSEDATSNSEEAVTKCETGGMREWTDVRGRTMNAEFIHADDMTVTFKLESGKVIDLPLTKLSEASQAAIKECR